MFQEISSLNRQAGSVISWAHSCANSRTKIEKRVINRTGMEVGRKVIERVRRNPKQL